LRSRTSVMASSAFVQLLSCETPKVAEFVGWVDPDADRG
jgi:hypothetical protein